MGWIRAAATVCLAAAIAAASTSSAVADPPAVTLTLRASPAGVITHGPVTLSGAVTAAATGSVVTLRESEYPYRSSRVIRTTIIGANGIFSFRLYPDRNTRYVAYAGGAASDLVEVKRLGRRVVNVKALPLGRAGVSILVYHPADLHWGAKLAHWSFASGAGPYRSAPVTRTRKLSRYVIVVRTSVSLPAGRFHWRVCFHAPQSQALVDRRRPPGCKGWGDSGTSNLPTGYPGPSTITAAERYLAGRSGRSALAVVDSEGRLSGVHLDWTFPSASVVKSMLLVAYLRRLHAIGQHYVDAYSNSFLYPMINVSDNNAASQCYGIVGNYGLYAVAHRARMRDFSVGGGWLTTRIGAADMARYFFQMDSLIPREFVGYARNLLSTISGSQSWGVPAVARPRGYSVFFKGGWLPNSFGLVNQIARLEGHGRTFSIAVLTEWDPAPAMSYGEQTIAGTTGVLLG